MGGGNKENGSDTNSRGLGGYYPSAYSSPPIAYPAYPPPQAGHGCPPAYYPPQPQGYGHGYPSAGAYGYPPSSYPHHQGGYHGLYLSIDRHLLNVYLARLTSYSIHGSIMNGYGIISIVQVTEDLCLLPAVRQRRQPTARIT